MARKTLRPIALAFSDYHLNNWKEGNKGGKRTKAQIKQLKLLQKKAARLDVPILFAGDLLHNPKAIANRLLDELFDALTHNNIYGISGNHDQDGRNTIENPVPSYIQTLDKKGLLHCVDFKSVGNANFNLYGIPYIHRNAGFEDYVNSLKPKSPSILLIHTDLPGAKTPQGHEVGEHGFDNFKMFKMFDLVLAGHIHKKQKLAKNVFMLGATMEQKRNDAGCDMGYWIIYEDFTMKFKKLKAPRYRSYDADDTPPNEYDIWLPKEKPSQIESNEYKFHNKTNTNKLAKMYCREKNITDKAKIKALKKYLKR